jgi:ATP-binding cassette subfamily B protein
VRTFWRIIRLLGDYKWLTVVGFVLAFAQMGLGLAVPRVIQLTIDDALLGGDSGLLPWYMLALLAVAVVRFAVAFARRYVTGKASLGIEYDLRNRLWAHLLRQPHGYYDRWLPGQLMSRAMSDVQNVRMFLGYGIIFFTVNLVMMFAVAVILLLLDWRLALLSLSFLPVLLLVTWRFSTRLQPILKDVQQRLADVTAKAEENVVGSRIVRIFAREDDELAKFSERSTRVFEASVNAARTRAVYIPLIAFIPNLAVAFLLWYGGRQVTQGELTLGALVAFYTYLMMLVYPAQVIGWLTGLAQRAIASGDRVYELLDAPVEMEERPGAAPLPALRGDVVFEGVTFSYADRDVLVDVDLAVPAGRTVALVGPTGCGKTTLTNLIPRFYDVSGGRVLVDGHDVRDVKLDDLRGHIGVVTQDPFLFSISIADNIRVGRPEASDDEVRAAARAAQVEEFVLALTDGYETVVGERGFTLSGGQRQRIAIARALVMDPRILVLDDATSSVDVETEFRIRQALREVMKGRTTFIIAHRPSTISLAEEVVVLDRGRVVERGAHDELMAANTLYRRMFGRAEREQRTFDEFVRAGAEDGAPAGEAAAVDGTRQAGDGELGSARRPAGLSPAGEG